MPPSSADLPVSEPDEAPGQRLAVLAEALYLANLLVLPGVAFLVLGIVFMRAHSKTPPLASAHLEQTLTASLWAGVLLVFVNLLILALGGYRAPETWVVLIVYFTVCHASFVLLGMVGLAKALSGQCWRFPVVGRDLPHGCGESA